MASLHGIVLSLALLPLSWLANPAHAHDPGLSFADVRIAGSEVAVTLTFARRELEPLVPIDVDGDGAVSDAEFAAARPRLRGLAPLLFTVRAGSDDREPRVTSLEIDDSDAVRIALLFDDGGEDPVGLRAPILTRLARGHRQYLSIRSTGGQPVANQILDAGTAAVVVPRTAMAVPSRTVPDQLVSFVREGVRHIWLGYDHLLFLVTLLLPAGLRRRAGAWQAVDRFGTTFRAILLVVTAFTVAHSITLGLAVLGLVELPPRLTEAAIAVSVVAAALNNVWPVVTRRLWAVAFGFGLIHGLGFAGALGELGLPRDAKLTALVGFNLGVELGQLAIVVVVLPLIYSLRHWQLYPRSALQVGSILVAGIGSLWLVERAIGA